LLITSTHVNELMSMKECFDVLENAFIKLSQGEAILPLRSLIRLPEKGKIFGMMPSVLNVEGHKHPFFGIKALSVFFTNFGTNYNSHQGVIPLFEGEFGQLIALVEAGSVTKLRTAAASGIATKYLARSDEDGPLVCCILGAGHQAESHIEAMLAVRKIKKIYIWNRTHSKAVTLAQHTTEKFKVESVATESLQEAISNSDIICTTTASTTSIVNHEWLKPGCHINAVGSSSPTTRELDSQTIAKSVLFTDRVESLENESGDYLIPLKEGIITKNHIRGELGDVLTKKVLGRSNNQEITIFKSLGISIEDIAVSQYIHSKAVKSDKGINLADFAKM